MKLLYNSHYPNLGYCIQDGVFYRLKLPTQAVVRVLIPDEQGMLSVKDALTQKYTFKKASILAWEFISGAPVPASHVVYFKNLNTKDYKGYNIACIPRSAYSSLRDAIDNLQGTLKLIPHSTEVYTYKVRHKHKGKTVLQSFHDVVDAQKFMRKVLIKSTKIMSKYLVSEN
jgi:hypothetical protein